MYSITLEEVTGKAHLQAKTDTNDIDRHMKEVYDADLFCDGVYIPNAPANQGERLFVSVDMTE